MIECILKSEGKITMDEDLLEYRKQELKKLIERGGSNYYSRKLKKVKACRSSINNILIYCPEAEDMENVDKEDFNSIKNAAVTFLEARCRDEIKYNKRDLARCRDEIKLVEIFQRIQERENMVVSKSPYSNSLYLYNPGEIIDWNCKPEGSYRLSNHWSFNGHCESSDIGCNELAIGKYVAGKYQRVN